MKTINVERLFWNLRGPAGERVQDSGAIVGQDDLYAWTNIEIMSNFGKQISSLALSRHATR